MASEGSVREETVGSEGAFEPRPPMASMPLLVGLAVVAALIDWSLARGALRVLSAGEVLEQRSLLILQYVLIGVRNVAAFAGIVALYGALSSWIRYRPFIHLALRVTVAGFAGILLPTLALSAILPAARTSPMIVLFASAAAFMLAFAMDNVAVHFGGGRIARISGVAVALASGLAFSDLMLRITAQLTLWEAGHAWALRLRPIGEGLYLLALLGLPLSTGFWRRPRGRFAGAAGAALGAGLVVAYVVSLPAVGTEGRDVVWYGMSHFEGHLKVGALPLSLVVTAVALALGLGAASASRLAYRQRAYAGLLLIAAGYLPTTPSTLLMWSLGAMLLARSLVAEGRPATARES
ncbi:MAG: hypothetical protein AAF938_03590 [Myxococcota bacterium]